MAIHMSGTSSKSVKSTTKSSSKSSKTEEVKVKAPARTIVKLVKHEDRVAAWLGVVSYPEELRLSAKETNALHRTPEFGGDSRKTFRFHKFWGSHPLEKAAPGRSWYWLCDVDGKEDLPAVEALVAKALTAKQPKAEAKATAEKIATSKRGKAAAAAKKPARRTSIVIA